MEAASALLEGSGEFMKQFGGSAAANLVTVAVLGVLMLLKKVCDRPSRCKSHLHCPCIDVEVMDRTGNTIRSVPKKAAGPGFANSISV